MMRFFKIWLSGLSVACAMCHPAAGQPAYEENNAIIKRPTGRSGWVNAGISDNVAATWHFAGSEKLADNPSFANLKTMLTLPSSLEFRHLVLDRFSDWLAHSLAPGASNGASGLIRPLLDDVLANESFWGLGGTNTGPLNFILAVKLSESRAKAWHDNLGNALGAPAEAYKQGAGSQRWQTSAGRSFWIIRAQDWTLVGNGDDLPSLQTQWRAAVEMQSRPGPPLTQSWLEADINWPRLLRWLPDSAIPFQPARTKIVLTVETNQLLALKASVHYSQPIPWKSEPFRVPYDLIRSPLVSFTTGQDIAAFMTPGEPLSRLADNPLSGQYYVWALSVMGLDSYAAWPVDNATNTLQHIATQAPAAFNADLARLHGGELAWRTERNVLQWVKLAPMFAPQLEVAPETNGQYLLASFFPLNITDKPAPPALFRQFIGRTNLVYYDWEVTGPRLDQWRLFAGMLPLFPNLPPGTDESAATNKTSPSEHSKPPVVIEENWLAGLTPMLMKNTVTEVTRTAPDELAVVRKSPVGLTALELVVFSHWFSGVGAAGINLGMLPPPAKVTGPGFPPGP